MRVDFHQGFTNNKAMSLPIYQHINLKSASREDVSDVLHPALNLKQPTVFNLKNLDSDEQREAIGLIENYFNSKNISFRFPYPIFIISDHQPSISKIQLVDDVNALPNFFTQRETKMNVRETHLANKNKLLQQEVSNNDASSNHSSAMNYGESHRIIYEQEVERKFYRSILNKLMKAT